MCLDLGCNCELLFCSVLWCRLWRRGRGEAILCNTNKIRERERGRERVPDHKVKRRAFFSAIHMKEHKVGGREGKEGAPALQ